MTARRSSAARLIAGRLALLALLGTVVLAMLVATKQIVLPYRHDPFATLDIRAERDWLTGFRLSRLKADPELCIRALDRARMSYRRLPDRDDGGGCDLTNVVELPAAASGLDGRAMMTCSVAASLAMFETHVVAPAARTHLGTEVRQMLGLGTYACRRIAGSSTRMSQHATANAIDISGFVLADGRRITLSRDWTGEGAAAAFLRTVRDGACASFTGVLGPDYNAAHADHFHLDNGPYRICR